MTRAIFPLALLCLLSCSIPGAPQSPPTDSPRLQKIISFEKSGKLLGLLDHFQAVTGIPVAVDPRLARNFGEGCCGSDNPVEIVLRDVSAGSALRWILRLSGNGLDFAERDGMIVVDERSRIRSFVRRLVDIDGLQVHPVDQPGSQLTFGPEGTHGFMLTTTNVQSSTLGEEALIDLLKETVRPNTWEGNQTIERADSGHLLVTAAPDVQDEVARFLQVLRKFPLGTVSIDATIVDAADAAVVDEVPRALSPAESDVLLRRLAAAPSCRFAVTAFDSVRAHTEAIRRKDGLHYYEPNGNPVLATWTTDISIVDVRPSIVDGGHSISIELRLSLGRTRDLDPVKTPSGPLPLEERTASHLATTVRVPNGGALLFSLPSPLHPDSRPQWCLLRAVTRDAAGRAPEPCFVHPPNPLIERLSRLSRMDADFSDAPLAAVAAWLREATGLNWLVAPGLRESRVSLHAKDLSVPSILDLLLPPLKLDYRAAEDAFLIAPRTFRSEPETWVFDTRSTLLDPAQFPGPVEEEDRPAFTGEDLANLLKNSMKDAWEEAEGQSIQLSGGLLIVRNSPVVIRDCARFLENLLHTPSIPMDLRAELLSVPAADAPAEAFIDDARADGVRKAAGPSRELLAWQAMNRQRTSLTWSRQRDFLAGFEEKGASSETQTTRSMIDLRPILSDGGTIGIDLQVLDERVVDVREVISGAQRIQTPVVRQHRLATSFQLPAGKTAVFTLASEDASARILLIRARPR